MAKALKKKTIRRTGCGQDEAGNWYVEIQAKDPSGRPAKWCFSMAALSRDEKPLWEFLGSKGHIISQRQRPQLRHVLLGLPGKNPDFAMATMMGWHEGAFVTPHDIYGDPNDRVHAQFPEALDRRKWEPRGELSRWRTEIAGICRGNPLLRFAVMVAFVPPVLRLLGLPTVGFSWVGDPSLGKSSALALAGSVWGGNPERPMGFCETLLKTANAFDKVGRRYRHTFLPMDEAHLASAQTLADLVHRLAAGESKETAIGETLPTHTSLVYVLTSNQPLAEILIKHKVHFDESYNARLIEIPVVKPRGMFHRLPNDLTAHDFAGRIAKAVTDQYGTAIDRYLTKLTSEYAEDKDALITWLRARMAWMERRLAINGNIPGEARRGQYF
ncbi:MAG: DUF927 domain-containing protein, partial [Blastocatellia bacterium]